MSKKEDDPLGGFDVVDFLSALDRDVRSGKKIGDSSGHQSLENELTNEEREELRKSQVDLLTSVFPNNTSILNRTIRELAQEFKKDFDSHKAAALKDPKNSLEVRALLTRITISNLAQIALEEHQTYARRSGQAEPNSFEARGLQERASRWDKVHQIVLAASEIRD